tara:strand:+ start:525 stop:731 length:207 start_codon:yes stop_codon:yes gene_type:complete
MRVYTYCHVSEVPNKKPGRPKKRLAPMTSVEFSLPIHEWVEKEAAKRGWTKKRLLETAVGILKAGGAR